MEDIWKDITLTGTTLQGQPSSKHRDPNTGIFFQDLLSSTPSNHPNPINEITAVEFSLFPSTPPMQRPNTALNLNSAPEKSHYQPEATDELNHRRHKRMIKNREAASRSRARKQAYTEGMELTVAHLMKENAKLRKEVQQAQRCLGTSAEPFTEKGHFTGHQQPHFEKKVFGWKTFCFSFFGVL